MAQNGPASSATADVVANMTPNNEDAQYMTSQTAQFTETQPGEVMEFNSTKESPNVGASIPQLELNKFLERPTLIQTITWGSGGVSTGRFNPWTDFLTNAYIQNKLENYALFRGDLHIKLVISANPFTYGAALLSYTPIQDYMTDTIATTTGALQNSQKPHVWVWPQNNAGGELVLPFFWKSPFIDIRLTATTDLLGECFLEEVIGLDTANDVAIPTLTIQVYAWCTNVRLGCPTTQLILQAGESEYKQGPVERIATTVAGISAALTTVPMIEPFAIATTMASSAVAGIASLFGWSKAILIEGARPFRPLFYHGFASSEVCNAMDKFALDQKAELSVDPRLLNLSGQDELALSYVLQKEAYVANSNWLSSDSVGDQLFEFPVWPMIMRNTDNTTYHTLQMTPMAYFAALFRYWRGDIVFRFRLVASQYHRGRIKITYEPKGEVGASDYTNVALTKIVDITEENDITFKVPYSQEHPWLRTLYDPEDGQSIGYDYGKTGSASHCDNYTNGTIRVQVLTTLTSPQATPSCHIIAYARGGENLELAVPVENEDQQKYSTHLALQAGIEDMPDISTGAFYDNRYLVNMGEQICSLRQLMSRSSLSQKFSPAVGDTTGYDLDLYLIRHTRTPVPLGYNSGAYLESQKIVTPGTDSGFCFSYMHPINWVSACYAAMRGGIQVNYVSAPGSSTYINSMKLNRVKCEIGSGDDKTVGELNPGPSYASTLQTAASTIHSMPLSTGTTACVLSSGAQCPVLSGEMTDQHQYLFNLTRQENWLRGTSIDDSNQLTYQFELQYVVVANAARTIQLDKYINISADFNLHFFVCTPSVYFSPSLGQAVV